MKSIMLWALKEALPCLTLPTSAQLGFNLVFCAGELCSELVGRHTSVTSYYWWWNAACARNSLSSCRAKGGHPSGRRQAGIWPVPWHILLHSAVTCSPVSLFTTSVLLLLVGPPLSFETAASSTAPFTAISFAFLFSPFPYLAAQKQLKFSIPNQQCFNVSMNLAWTLLKMDFLARTKYQPTENQD